MPPGVEPIQTLRCGHVTFADNRTFAGGLLPRLDPETDKYLPEWDTPAEEVLAAACFAG